MATLYLPSVITIEAIMAKMAIMATMAIAIMNYNVAIVVIQLKSTKKLAQ